MTNNIKSFPVYRVKFERFTSVKERIAGIFCLSDFLGRISGWHVARNWSGIFLLIFWNFMPKLLGYSRDWFIQPQKNSPSFNATPRNKTYFTDLTTIFKLRNTKSFKFHTFVEILRFQPAIDWNNIKDRKRLKILI